MSQSTKMESLPEVALWKVIQHLTGCELSKWSSVNRHFREYLNHNGIWKPLCNPATAEYLKNTRCQVEPVFTSPEIEDSGLSRICEWRMSFMREVHLRNNWRNNRRVDKFVPYTRQNANSFTFYDNDYFIVHNERSLEVWSAKESPLLLCSEPLLPKNRIVELFEIFDDKIIIKRNDLVGVFQLSTTKQELVLLHTFIYHKSHKIPSSPGNSYVDLCDKTDLENLCSSSLVGNILVVLEESYNTLHVWNIETGEKVKEMTSSEFFFEPIDYASSQPPYWSTVVEKKGNRQQYVALVYKLPDFTEMFISNTYACTQSNVITTFLAEDKVVIVSYIGKSTDVYSFTTGNQLFTIPTIENTALPCGYPSTPVFRKVDGVLFYSTSGVLGRFTSGVESLEWINIPPKMDGTFVTIISQKFVVCFENSEPSTPQSIAEIKGIKLEIVNESFGMDTCNDFLCVNESTTKMLYIVLECPEENPILKSWLLLMDFW